MIQCPNGHEVSDNVRFCPTCGAAIVRGNKYCTKCGRERMGTEKFCSQCGTPYGNSSINMMKNNSKRSNTVKKGILIASIVGVIGLFVLALGGGAAWYFLYYQNRYSMEGLARVAAEYDYIESFHEGLAGVVKDNKLGVINTKGEIIVIPTYDSNIHRADGHSRCWYKILFIDGYAMVKKNDKYGYIDKSGNEVIPCIYDNLSSFSEGLAAFATGNKWGYIDKKGNVIIKCQYKYASEFKDGIARVATSKGYTFIDKSGNNVSCGYLEAGDINEGLAWVRGRSKEGEIKCGFIDKHGKVVIPLTYDFVCDFSDGLARVRKNGKYGYIDKNGKEAIPIIYDDANAFSGGVAVVNKDGKFGIIDKNGHNVTSFEFDYYSGECSEGLILIGKNERMGLINNSGNVVIPFNYGYGDVGVCINGFIYIKEADKYGFANKNGETIIPCIYEKAEDFSEGLAVVMKDGIWGFIDQEGNSTFDVQDEDIKALLAEKKRKLELQKLEEEETHIESSNNNYNNSRSSTADVSSILSECESQIRSIQSEIESLCNTYVQLISRGDADEFKHERMRITLIRGVGEWQSKANTVFDRCIGKLNSMGETNEADRMQQEKREFYNIAERVKNEALQRTGDDYYN